MDQVVFGKNASAEIIKNAEKRVKNIIIANESREDLTPLIQEAKEKCLQLQYMPSKNMNRILHDAGHQGIIVYTWPTHYVEIEDIIGYAKERNEKAFIVLLDSVKDPHNLGAILRSADGAGIHGLVIPKTNSVEVTPTVEKVSTGAAEFVPIARVTNMNHTIATLKESGIWIVGVENGVKKSYFEQDLNMPVALVFGSEGEGIRKSIKENCDFLVNIPMKGKVSSLNVSVSAAVLMYEVVRQRSKKE